MTRVLGLLVVVCLLSTGAFAANLRMILIDRQPMVSLYDFGRAFDATVDYDEGRDRISIALGNRLVQCTPSSRIAWIDGRSCVMEAPVVIIDDVIYIPIRFMSDAFGLDYDCRDIERQVTIRHRTNTALILVLVFDIDWSRQPHRWRNRCYRDDFVIFKRPYDRDGHHGAWNPRDRDGHHGDWHPRDNRPDRDRDREHGTWDPRDRRPEREHGYGDPRDRQPGDRPDQRDPNPRNDKPGRPEHTVVPVQHGTPPGAPDRPRVETAPRQQWNLADFLKQRADRITVPNGRDTAPTVIRPDGKPRHDERGNGAKYAERATVPKSVERAEPPKARERERDDAREKHEEKDRDNRGDKGDRRRDR